VELYRTAWLAEDWDLLEAIWSGADIHSLNASTIYGCAPEAARTTMVRFEGGWKDARYAAKRATHGWDYYMGARLTARLYGLKEAEAQRAIGAYFGRWRAIRAWQERQIDRASATRHLTNSFGYKLRFFGFSRGRDGAWRVADPAIAVAFAPASEVAFMAKFVLPRLNEVRAGDSRLLTMTHDSFTFDVQRDAMAQHIAEVKPILEREWGEFGTRRGRRFAAKVDVAAGRNWGKRHVHGEKCGAECPQEENTDGLVDIA
jgi:DNA polymerase-1